MQWQARQFRVWGFEGFRGLGFIVYLLLEGEFMVEGQDFGPLSRLYFVCMGSPRVQDQA